MLPLLLFIAHLFATIFMTGLIWVVQLVHYPLFIEVGESAFAKYETLHQQKITLIVAPLMLLELGTAWALVYFNINENLFWGNAILVLLIWLSTFLLQMPLHFQLSEGFDVPKIKLLVRSNWIRTGLWTIRSFLLLWILMKMMV